ncbi:MAG: hypothetical protein LBI01_05265 [Elusimicrobium sp.]|jgi:hypothetical protein|nr:hypothetical protein [Elusimicrobium sp.]
MKKFLPAVLLLLFIPLLANAGNALDEANNIRGNLNNPDGSAGYIQTQYLTGQNSVGGKAPAAAPNSTNAINGNNPNGTSGVTIDAVAALNEGQNTDAADMLKAEQDLRASREKSLLSYCLIVFGMALITGLVGRISANNPVTAWIYLALLAATITMITIGFVKLFKGYPDGVNPSNTTKAICSATLMVSIVVMGGSILSPLGLFGLLATGLSFLKSGNKTLAKDLVSKGSSTTQSANTETAEQIQARADQYKNGGGQ